MTAPFFAAKRYELSDKEIRSVLLPSLLQRVFHVTRYQSLQQIKEAGCIDPNTDGSLGDSFPGSNMSYGRHKGYVCFFDFRNKTPEAISWGLNCCNFMEANHLGNRIAVLLLDTSAYARLIPVSAVPLDDKKGTLSIPQVESWYPGAVSLELIAEVFDVSIHRTPVLPDSLPATVIAAAESLKKGYDD